MTVCIAAINNSGREPAIIIACDRKISFGGSFSADGSAMKITGANKDWAVMFAGDVSAVVPLLEAIKESAEGVQATGVRAFARVCSEAYTREREVILENDVLGDYDIKSYSEYLSLKKSDPTLYESISQIIYKSDQERALLFAGFDAKTVPHIFIISERGKIRYCDTEGFAAIGSGEWSAIATLSAYPFKRNLPFTEAIFSVASAKFTAETQADGVGKETVLAILEPNRPASGVMASARVEAIKEMWRSLPRFPSEATGEIQMAVNDLKTLGLVSKDR